MLELPFSVEVLVSPRCRCQMAEDFFANNSLILEQMVNK